MTARLALVLAAAFAVVASAQQASPKQQEQPYRPGPGVENPVVIRSVQPRYTDEAMRNQIQGGVELEAVVLSDGAVGDVRVVKSLDSTFGLDNEAVVAAKQWLFRPGRLTSTGRAVPVRVTIMLEFRLEPSKTFAKAFEPMNIVANDDFYQDAYSPLRYRAPPSRPASSPSVPPRPRGQGVRYCARGLHATSRHASLSGPAHGRPGAHRGPARGNANRRRQDAHCLAGFGNCGTRGDSDTCPYCE